jgi:hypothetical protein
MGSATILAGLGSYVSEQSPTRNFNTATGLALRTGGLGEAYSYLFWSRPFPLKANIISAKIKFYTTAMATGTHTITMARPSVPWSQSRMTWVTRPAIMSGTKQVTKTGVQADKTLWEFDVADWMQTVANGGIWQGVKLVNSESVLHWIYSEIHPLMAYRPVLEVTWSDAPSTPTGLAPSGGRAVGLAKPVVRATYIDVSGATTQQAINVQINSTDVWTLPTFDSGTVLTSVPELDLNTTAYAGLADGSTTFWRLRFQDAAGIWSPWSAAASFKRDDKGTLTVDSPPSGTPTVEDTTPPIAWTFVGETQAAYQVQIRHAENGVQVIDWDSGKVTSTATSVTVPSGKITETLKTFTVTVRVWDNKQREAVPGSPTYQEVVRNFTFVPGATIGTTGLTVTPLNPRPRVTLQWTSATFPDRFNIVRNGRIIATGLDPNDTFVSGTTHTWTDESPSPKRSLVYSVQRVVNNVASATNSTATTTLDGGTVWLREPLTGLEICITGREARDFTFGESGASLQPIAPNANKIVINQSLGGLEGRISGDLADGYGKTAQQWRDDFLKMRALRVKKFLLTVNDYTFSVVCREFTYSPMALPLHIFKVSFAFFQQDSIDTLRTG